MINDIETDDEMPEEPVVPTDSEFMPSFASGDYYEFVRVKASLEGFYGDRLITDVTRRIKGGKEAGVYLCAAHPSAGVPYLAAKVYRSPKFRALRNTAIYREGRACLGRDGKAIHDRRALKAIRHKTRYGRQLETGSWRQNEYDALRRAHAAGADMIRPVAGGGNAVLMEYLGEPGYPAPLLLQVRLEREEAQALWQRLLRNVELFLACDCIHADLSAFNVLYWRGEIRIIDLPQAVDAVGNPHAFELLHRDLDRLCRYFIRYGIVSDSAGIAEDLWWRYQCGELMVLPMSGEPA